MRQAQEIALVALVMHSFYFSVQLRKNMLVFSPFLRQNFIKARTIGLQQGQALGSIAHQHVIFGRLPPNSIEFGDNFFHVQQYLPHSLNFLNGESWTFFCLQSAHKGGQLGDPPS